MPAAATDFTVFSRTKFLPLSFVIRRCRLAAGASGSRWMLSNLCSERPYG
jgi:hypothetical protein